MNPRPGRRLFVDLIIVVAVVAVAGGLMLIGSPAEERLRGRARINDLSNILAAVNMSWTRRRTLAGFGLEVEAFHDEREIDFQFSAVPWSLSE